MRQTINPIKSKPNGTMTSKRQGLQHVSSAIETIFSRHGIMDDSQQIAKFEPSIDVRPGLDFDRKNILDIDRGSFDIPLTVNELRELLNLDRVFVDIAVLNKHRVCGYVIYKFTERGIELVRIAVDKKFRRIGVGRKLILSVCDEIEENSIRALQRVIAFVRETNLPYLGFLRKLNFRAGGIKTKHFPCGTTAYFMHYQLGFDQVQDIVKNRFTK